MLACLPSACACKGEDSYRTDVIKVGRRFPLIGTSSRTMNRSSFLINMIMSNWMLKVLPTRPELTEDELAKPKHLPRRMEEDVSRRLCERIGAVAGQKLRFLPILLLAQTSRPGMVDVPKPRSPII